MPNPAGSWHAISWIWGGELRGYDYLTQPLAIPLPGGQAQFAVNKLLDRGSRAATTIVANVQDFITIVARQLGVI